MIPYDTFGKLIYYFKGLECPHSLVNILGIVVANSDDYNNNYFLEYFVKSSYSFLFIVNNDLYIKVSNILKHAYIPVFYLE